MLEVNTPALAFFAGLLTSIHCVGMCGPIACSLTALKKDENSRIGAATAYHGGRLISYTAIGAMLGAIGAKPLEYFHHSSMSFFPWVLVAIFVAIAFGLEKKIPRPAFLKKWTARLRLKALTISATRGGLVMGLATPLLPCAPLYIFFAACLTTGSAIQGAEFALAFAIGTVPLLWASQLGMQQLQLRLSRDSSSIPPRSFCPIQPRQQHNPPSHQQINLPNPDDVCNPPFAVADDLQTSKYCTLFSKKSVAIEYY